MFIIKVFASVMQFPGWEMKLLCAHKNIKITILSSALLIFLRAELQLNVPHNKINYVKTTAPL